MATDATVRLGELRRRQGRLDEAAEIFEQLAEHPLALLGIGEICLDRGDPTGAHDRAEQYLRETPPQTTTRRCAGLELLIRAQVGLGENKLATAALQELEAVAGLVATAPLRASACFAASVLASAAGDFERARTAAEDATRLFHRSGAPFEAARARIELARAHTVHRHVANILTKLDRASRSAAVAEALRRGLI